ncbi:MAG: DUF1801 domain-containing protein [Anaerolineae bacterium]|nr:DUF1801 domain-containing protein [Anaerolineae bacterium]
MTDYTISQDEQVQQFLDDLLAADVDKYEIVQQARQIMLACHPQANECIKYGGILFALDEDFGGLFVSRHHVKFDFTHGYKLDDPNNLLEGSGEFRRHLKFKTEADVAEKQLRFFIEQAH